MVPVVRAVLTTPYPRWDQWELARCAQAVGMGGSGVSSDGHLDREVESRDVDWKGHVQKVKLERLSVNVGSGKAETMRSVQKRAADSGVLGSCSQCPLDYWLETKHCEPEM